MKKAVALFLLVFIVFAAASCSSPLPSGRAGFSAVSSAFDILDLLCKDLKTLVNYPSYDAELSGSLEWANLGEEFTGVYPDVRISGSYSSGSSSLSASAVTPESRLDITSGGGAAIFNGLDAKSSLVRVRAVYEKYIRFIADNTEDGDYKTVADNIRVTDEDAEVSRITLTLSPEKYADLITKTVNAFCADKDSYDCISGALSVYADLHKMDKSGAELLEEALGYIKETALNADGNVKWTRCVRDGKAYSERADIPVNGETVSFYYSCPVAEREAELKFNFESPVMNAELYCLYRKSDISDTFNVQFTSGDQVTVFDVEVRVAHKSGSGSIRVAAQNEKGAYTATGAKITVYYNGVKDLTYSGDGYVMHGDIKREFSYSLGYSHISAKSDKQDTEVYAKNVFDIYTRIKTAFPDIQNYTKG